MSFTKIAALKVLFYLGLQMNAFLHFSHLLSDLYGIWYKRPARNAAENLRV